jgi:TPP-dependent pyruvate/acetoin dehydrogenase alpha subunit
MVDEAVKLAESIEHPHPEEMFTYIYEKLTPRQMKELKDF